MATKMMASAISIQFCKVTPPTVNLLASQSPIPPHPPKEKAIKKLFWSSEKSLDDGDQANIAAPASPKDSNTRPIAGCVRFFTFTQCLDKPFPHAEMGVRG